MSIYSLVNKTKSPNGSKYLKYMLRCLPRDIQVIANRQNALAYFMHPSQLETVRLMKEALSKIRSIHQFLKKLNFNQVSVPDWKALKSTLTHMLYLSQICANTVALDSNAPHVIFHRFFYQIHGSFLRLSNFFRLFNVLVKKFMAILH